MRKYVRLGWDNYYPCGGLGNVLASFDSLEEAREYEPTYHLDWAAVADRDTWQVIEEWQLKEDKDW